MAWVNKRKKDGERDDRHSVAWGFGIGYGIYVTGNGASGRVIVAGS